MEQTFAQEIYDGIKRRGACASFDVGHLNMSSLLRWLLRKEGRDFCAEHGYPTMDMWHRFAAEYDAPAMGVYVDAGDVQLDDPDGAILVGDTHATVKCRRGKAHRIAVLHGAKLHVDAGDFSVVFIYAEPFDPNVTVTKTSKSTVV